MLNLDSRQQILGVTVFQDTDRPTQFYYLPGDPHITIQHGEPLFDLFTYRKGGAAGTDLAGGFLNMTVDVGIGTLKDQIQSKLKEQYGDGTTLSPVPFTKGTAHVVALGEDSQAVHGDAASETAPSGGPLVAHGPRFIQNILGAGKPSLDGDNRAIFSFSLSEDGAAFFMGLFSGSVRSRPVGVIYDLTYVGLLPAYDLEITIDFKSCYDYLRTRFTLGTLLFKADVDNVVEQLKRQEAIKIRETSRTLELSKPEAIRERQDRIDQLVKQLASGALFQPALTPGQPKVQGDVITAADPTSAVSAALNARPGESRTMAALRQGGPTAASVVGMGEAHGLAANPDAIGAPGAAGAGAAGAGGQPAGTQPGGGDATSSSAAPQTAGDLWNQLGRPQAAFAVKEIRQEEQLTVTYSLTQVTAQEQPATPQSFIQMLASPEDLAQRVHLVDLNNPFFQRININVTARDVDFAAEGISQMTVQLRYGTRPDGTAPKDTAEAILRSRDDSKDFTFFADGKQTQSYEYKLILDYQHNFGIGVRDDHVEGPWTRTEARSLAVHPSWLGLTLPVTLQLAPNIPPDVGEAQARVRYTNAARGIDDSTMVRLNAQAKSQLVPVRMADPADQFEIATTLFYTDGTNEALPAVRLPNASAGASDNAAVISAPRANRLDGDIIMQDPLGELESVLADTQVEQDHALVDSHTHEMTKANQREVLSVRLPKRDVASVLRYRERRLFRDGGLEEDDWHEALSPNLVVGIPAARTMSVAVNYIGPALSVLGLSALELDLSYADPNGNAKFAQSTSLLITDEPGTHNQDWKIRLPDNQARTYHWNLTLIHADGTQTKSDDTAETRDRLILRVPRL
jgi:hypothetical protein